MEKLTCSFHFITSDATFLDKNIVVSDTVAAAIDIIATALLIFAALLLLLHKLLMDCQGTNCAVARNAEDAAAKSAAVWSVEGSVAARIALSVAVKSARLCLAMLNYA